MIVIAIVAMRIAIATVIVQMTISFMKLFVQVVVIQFVSMKI
jgi:hypothetical protein